MALGRTKESLAVRISSLQSRSCLLVSIGRVFAASEKKAKYEPGSEPSDVRHVRNATLAGLNSSRVLTEDLNNDPEAQHDDGRKLDCRPEEPKRKQSPNPISREHYQICSEYPRNSAGGAQ